jgi:hypothetical protein
VDKQKPRIMIKRGRKILCFNPSRLLVKVCLASRAIGIEPYHAAAMLAYFLSFKATRHQLFIVYKMTRALRISFCFFYFLSHFLPPFVFSFFHHSSKITLSLKYFFIQKNSITHSLPKTTKPPIRGGCLFSFRKTSLRQQKNRLVLGFVVDFEVF